MTSPIPPLARAAAKVLDQAADENAEPSVDRAKVVRAIEGALKDRQKRRRRGRLLGAFGAVAAGVAIAIGAWAAVHSRARSAEQPPVAAMSPAPPTLRAEHVRGDVFVTGDPDPMTDPPVRLADGAQARLGERIIAREGTASLVLRSGTKLEIEPNTDLRVVEDDAVQTVHLAEGAVTATVAKVRPGARFVVRAGDVEVEVRGTVFRVERHEVAGCGLSTRVAVTEGRVSVHGLEIDRQLSANEAWTSSCTPRPTLSPTASAAPASEPSPTVSARRQPELGPSRAIATPAPPSSVPVTASELAAQNAAFRDALAKSREDPAGAVIMLDAFLHRYPNAPLEEAVVAKRMRLLVTFGDPRAVAAARDYLARYPNGFARHEAAAALAAAAKGP